MTWHYTPYAGALTIAATISGLLAAYAWWVWRHRAAPGGLCFTVLMLSVTAWSVASALEMAVVEAWAKILCSKFQYLGITTVAPLWLMFALSYSQRGQRLTRRNIALLFVVPAITIALAATNEWHGLIWPRITPVSEAPGALLIYDHGIAFWVHAVYSYALLLLGTILVVRTTLRSYKLYRYQAGALLLGVVIPWLGNAIYITGLNPFPGLDLTPFAFTLTGVLVAWGLFRYQLLDLGPVARDAVVANMVDGILVVDRQDRIMDVNPAAQFFLGITPAAIGQPVDEALAAWPDLIARYKGMPGAQTEIMLGSPENSRWLDTRVSFLYDRRRQLTGRLIVLRDITERKQADEELLRYMRELEASNAELDAFAQTVAHDLKNPLTSLIGYSDLVVDQINRLSPEMMREFLQAISVSGSKMVNIIDALLLLSTVRKMEHVGTGALDMADIVDEARARLSSMIAEYKAEITAPDRWPIALGYGPWVEEVWVNYISNAVKYGGDPEQGIPSRVELGADVDGNSHVRFWVRDNGQGLVPDQQRQLFIQFTRLHEISAEGYGLGLSIVRRIVERLGGEVGVESHLGQGSTFYFTLPAAESE
jgi:PAS domain S-box-containing protein